MRSHSLLFTLLVLFTSAVSSLPTPSSSFFSDTFGKFRTSSEAHVMGDVVWAKAKKFREVNVSNNPVTPMTLDDPEELCAFIIVDGPKRVDRTRTVYQGHMLGTHPREPFIHRNDMDHEFNLNIKGWPGWTTNTAGLYANPVEVDHLDLKDPGKRGKSAVARITPDELGLLVQETIESMYEWR